MANSISADPKWANSYGEFSHICMTLVTRRHCPYTLCDSLLVPPQGVIPTLRDLSLLPVPNWYLLGLQLGVSGHELDVIESNYPRDNNMCKMKMFAAWLRVDASATYEKLARALVTVGKRNIAKAMCDARGKQCSCVYCNTTSCP